MAAPPNVVAHQPHFHRNEAWKQPVRLATTAAGTLATDFDNGSTIDGHALATGDRLLVKDQADAKENGIYLVAASGAPARAFDMDVAAEVVGAIVPVIDGDTNAGTLWRVTTLTTPVLDTDAITLEQLSGGAAPATTVTDETTWGVSPAVGTGAAYAREDHTHGTPAQPAAGVGALLIADAHSTPLVFADLLQSEAGDDLLYADL